MAEDDRPEGGRCGTRACRPLGPLILSLAAPNRFETSGATAATAW